MKDYLRELKLQSAIEQRLARLVGIAEALIDELDSEKIRNIDASQLRNAIAVANTAPHPAVLTNFIRYQMGRSGKPQKAWRDTGLGDKVNKQIEVDLKALAGNVATDARRGSSQEPQPDEVDEIHIRLTRLMLGFMNRYFVYKKDGADKSQGKKGDEQRQPFRERSR